MQRIALHGVVALLVAAPAVLRADPAPSPDGGASPLPGPTIVVAPEVGNAGQSGPGVVNINLATVDELTRLPGIGQVKAQAIVAFRAKAKFVRKEQLLSVRGIGPKLLQQLRPYVVIDGSTTLRSKVRLKR